MVETIRILRSGAPGFRKAFAALRATHAADQRRAEAAAAEIVGFPGIADRDGNLGVENLIEVGMDLDLAQSKRVRKPAPAKEGQCH